MRINPYAKTSQKVRDALMPLILPEDSYHRTHESRIARTLQLLLKENPKGKLLELGTGGVVPLALSEMLPEVELHVTEFRLDEPEVGTKNFEIAGRSIVDVPTYRIDLESTPIPVEDETFDVVMCCEVIEHMEIDPMFMVAEINRVLKPGGLLVLTTPNIVSSRGITKMLHGIEPYFYMQYRPTRNYYRHNYEYSIHSIAAVLNAGGFSGLYWTEDSFEDPVLKDVEKLRKIGYPMEHIGDNIFALVRKVGPVKERHPGAIYSD